MDKKDPKNDSNPALTRFGRDKRVRTVTSVAERVERRSYSPREAADTEHTSYEPKRRSYNPNFTRDNRPNFEEKPRTYGDKPAYSDRPQRSFEGRPRRPYGERSFNHEHDFNRDPDYNREPARERNFNRASTHDQDFNRERDFNREEHPGRPRTPRYGENRPYGAHRTERTEGEYRPRNGYHSERSEGEHRSPRPYGSKPSYGSYNKKGSSNREGGYSSYGERRDDRSFGSRNPRGSQGDKRTNGRFNKSTERQRSYPSYAPEVQTGAIRLNRFIAQSGLCSRREADDFILSGVVTVNGQVVTELGTKVMPTDEVRFNDARVAGEKKVYLVLNKPKGYVTSLDDPHASKTVMDLVKGACTERIYPVGRLDKNSLGLLLFTNDGDLTKQLTHPTYQKKKIYQVTLDKPLTRADMDRIAEGITLDDGEIHADAVSYIKENKQEIGVEIHSGRNRIVRRIFEFLGYEVRKLDRVYYAGLTKKNLKRGAWRFLTDIEVQRLKSGLYE